MKNIFVLIAVILSISCVHGRIRVIDNIEVKQCSIPNLYLLSSVPSEMTAHVVAGMNYWSEALGKKIFVLAGVVEFKTKQQ